MKWLVVFLVISNCFFIKQNADFKTQLKISQEANIELRQDKKDIEARYSALYNATANNTVDIKEWEKLEAEIKVGDQVRGYDGKFPRDRKYKDGLFK